MSKSSFSLLHGSHPERMHKGPLEHTTIPMLSSVTTQAVQREKLSLKLGISSCSDVTHTSKHKIHSTKSLNQWQEITLLLSTEGQPKQANVFIEGRKFLSTKHRDENTHK